MTDHSRAERLVYETIRHNTASDGSDRIPAGQVAIHLRNELTKSDIQQAVHELYRADLLDVDEGRYRPVDHDVRIPHPGEIDADSP